MMCSVNMTNMYVDQQLICVDLLKLHGVHTFISDDGQRRSWIDHVVCSRPLMSYFGGIKVLNGTISSDHLLISASFVSITPSDISSGHLQDTRPSVCYCDWSRASVNVISNFQHNVTTAVSQVSIPSCLLSCGGTCQNIAHHHAISKYYDLTTCVKTAVELSIPLSYIGSSKFSIPGWTDYVSDKHDMASDAFL